MTGFTRQRLATGAVIVILAAIVVGGVLALPLTDGLGALREFLARAGPAGFVLFFVIDVIGTATVVPAAPFSVLAGLLFGAAGFPLAVIAATTGAALAFLASRGFLRARVARMMARRNLFAAVDRAIDAQGWRVVGLTRMSPIVPFNVQSLLFGATRIRFSSYVVATAIGIMPNTALFVYLGTIGRVSAGDAGVLRWGMICVGLLCTLLAVILVSRAARRRMADVVQ